MVDGLARIDVNEIPAHLLASNAVPDQMHPHRQHDGYERLLAACQSLSPVRMAIVHPCSVEALESVLEARDHGLIVPMLVGPEVRIRALAKEGAMNLDGIEIVTTEHSHASAEAAVALARSGRVAALMKGSLHTDELLHAVLEKVNGLRTERRLSHVFVMDVPTYPRPLMITDAAVNIYPTLIEKRDIVQNAIDLAHRLGINEPRVAILSAVETVNPDIKSTIDAAALCKMAERGQIQGGKLDGPLAFDNAVSPDAARMKGISSGVAGVADILVVPDLEAGNMLVKQLTLLANADSAGIVLGARVPIVLASRADSVRNRLASVALGVLLTRPA
jgi:phosphate acetyltransferase